LAATEITVKQLPSFFTTLSVEIMRDHEKRFAAAIRSVKDASSAVSGSGARLATGVKNAWGTLDKMASQYGLRLAEIVQQAAGELAEKEVKANFHETEQFQQQAVESLNHIITTIKRYVPKLHRSLKPEMSALNGALAKLEHAIKGLTRTLDESPGHRLDALQRAVEILTAKHTELLGLRFEKQKEESEIEALAAKDKQVQAERERLTSAPEFAEINRYEASLRAKETEMKALLQPLLKPLLKLERAPSVNRNPINTRVLRNLIDDTVETVIAEQPFVVDQLLNRLSRALGNGELAIEERKRRKAEETIALITEGRLKKIRDEYLTLQANIQETMRQLSGKGLLQRRNELDRLIASTQQQKERSTAKQHELQKMMDDLTRVIQKQKTHLESELSKLAGRTITVATD